MLFKFNSYLDTLKKKKIAWERRNWFLLLFLSYSMIVGPKYKAEICVRCGFVIFKVSLKHQFEYVQNSANLETEEMALTFF